MSNSDKPPSGEIMPLTPLRSQPLQSKYKDSRSRSPKITLKTTVNRKLAVYGVRDPPKISSILNMPSTVSTRSLLRIRSASRLARLASLRD